MRKSIRFIAMVLTLCMVLGIMPLTAFAAPQTEEEYFFYTQINSLTYKHNKGAYYDEWGSWENNAPIFVGEEMLYIAFAMLCNSDFTLEVYDYLGQTPEEYTLYGNSVGDYQAEPMPEYERGELIGYVGGVHYTDNYDGEAGSYQNKGYTVQKIEEDLKQLQKESKPEDFESIIKKPGAGWKSEDFEAIQLNLLMNLLSARVEIPTEALPAETAPEDELPPAEEPDDEMPSPQEPAADDPVMENNDDPAPEPENNDDPAPEPENNDDPAPEPGNSNVDPASGAPRNGVIQMPFQPGSFGISRLSNTVDNGGNVDTAASAAGDNDPPATDTSSGDNQVPETPAYDPNAIPPAGNDDPAELGENEDNGGDAIPPGGNMVEPTDPDAENPDENPEEPLEEEPVEEPPYGMVRLTVAGEQFELTEEEYAQYLHAIAAFDNFDFSGVEMQEAPRMHAFGASTAADKPLLFPDIIHNYVLWDGTIMDEGGAVVEDALKPGKHYILVIKCTVENEAEEGAEPAEGEEEEDTEIGEKELPFGVDEIYIPGEGEDPGNFRHPAMHMLYQAMYPTLTNSSVGDPVDLLTGSFTWNYRDLQLEGENPLPFERFYSSINNEIDLGIGLGWSHSYSYKIERHDLAHDKVYLPGGAILFFETDHTGAYVEPEGSAYRLFYTGGGYTLTHENGEVITFDGDGNLIGITRVNGDQISISNSGGKISSVTNMSGTFTFQHSGDHISAITDSAGRTVTYGYAGDNLASMINPDGDSMTYSYDGNNQITDIVDFNGTLYLRNTYKDNQIATQYVAGQGTSTFKYDFEGGRNRFDRNDGFFTEITFDQYRRILSKTDNDGTIFYTYDEYNRRVAEYDRMGREYKYTYLADKSIVTSVTHPNGDTESYTYNALGQVTSHTRLDGTTVKYDYNGAGKLTGMTDANGGTTKYAYDGNGFIQSATDALGNVSTYTTDSSGNILTVTDPLGNTTAFTYDGVGRVTSKTSPLGHTTSYAYSIAGKLVTETDALGNTITYDYTPNGYETNITDRNGGTFSYTYNDMNQPLTATDALGHTTMYAYDEVGNLLKSTSPEGRQTSYTYDKLGRPVSMTDGRGNTYKLTYDANGKLTTTVDPLGGKTAYVYDIMEYMTDVTNPRGATTSYETDAMGRVTKMTDPMGGVTKYAYDKNGNVVSVTDPNGNTTQLRYDAENRLTSTTDALGGVTTYTYNEIGQLINITTADGESSGLGYDADGNLVSTGDPLSHVTKIEYDMLSRPVKIIDALDGETRFTYDNNGNLLSETDENGNTARYTYNANDQLTSITNPMGGVMRYAYTPDGFAESITDTLGHVTAYEYDKNGNVIKVTEREGGVFHYAYDAMNRVSSVTDANGNMYSYAYDANGNLIKGNNPDGGVEAYEYDLNDRPIKYTDGEGYSTLYAYDANGNMVSVTDPRGNTASAVYDALDRIVKSVNEEGGEIHLEYDSMGRVTKAVNEDGAITRYEYDADGLVTKITDALGHHVSFEYDALHRVIAQTDENGVRRAFGYDAVGNVISYTDGLGHSEKYEYDANDRLVKATDRRGNSWTYTYDAMDRVLSETDAKGNTLRFGYDKNGRITSVMDKNGNTTKYVLDANGNIIEEIDADGNSTWYEYDSMNRLTAMKQRRVDKVNKVDELVSTLYTYDKRGLVVTEVNAKGDGKLYVYDGNGNLIQMTDEDRYVTEYEYSPINLVTKINYADGKSVSYLYNGTGELVEMEDWTGETSIGRDLLNRIKEVTDCKGRKTGYEYDPVGNLTNLTYPDGKVASYIYDAENQNTKLVDIEGLEMTFQFDPNGNLARKEYPNGEWATYTYDPNNQLTELMEYAMGNRQDYRTLYTWDKQGNRTGEVVYNHGQTGKPSDKMLQQFYDGTIESPQQASGSTPKNSTHIYSYDNLNRVVKAEEPENMTSTFTYDTLGNLTEQKVKNETTTFEYSSLNQLVKKTVKKEVTTYTYDNRGNRITERDKFGTDRYTFDATNMMVYGINEKGDASEYVYNGLKMRVERNHTYHSGSEDYRDYVVDIADPNRRDLMVYAEDWFTQNLVYANGQQVEMLSDRTPNQSGNGGLERLLYVHEDIMGSARYHTKMNGNNFAELEYDVYGAPHSPDKLENNDNGVFIGARYTNHKYDFVLDIYHAQYRFYDAKNRQFMSVDPVKDGLNWYNYVAANPTSWVDPLGLVLGSGDTWANHMKEIQDMIEAERERREKENSPIILPPSPTPTPTPSPTPTPTPRPTQKPTPTQTPKPETLLDEFIDYLEQQAKNESIYIWGAQGQSRDEITEKWIKQREKDDNNQKRALKAWEARLEKGGDFQAFDCSGLGMYWLRDLMGIYSNDMTADGMMRATTKVQDIMDLRRGDWVFRVDGSGKAYHIGYIVDDDLNVIESMGRDDGVTKRSFNANDKRNKPYWHVYGRPEVFEDYI